jgi:hypothetical protein
LLFTTYPPERHSIIQHLMMEMFANPRYEAAPVDVSGCGGSSGPAVMKKAAEVQPAAGLTEEAIQDLRPRGQLRPESRGLKKSTS